MSDCRDQSSRLGPFRLVRELGRGSQGVCWLAEDVRLEREVAVKVITRTPGKTGHAALEREMRVAAQLDHPGFVRVLDMGVEGGQLWIAMRYLRGQTLDAWVAQQRSHPEFRSRVLALLAKVGRALEFAHGKGLVHRDLKPSNILVGLDEQPVILDLGAALDTRSSHADGDSLRPQGTLAYMAPEALEALDAGPGVVGPQVDLWSLAVILQQVWTGELPFLGESPEQLVRRILEGRRPRPKGTRDLALVLDTALDPDPDRRYRSAAELAFDLERLASGDPVAARSIGVLGRLARWARRHPGIAAGLAVTLTSVGGMTLTSLQQAGAARDSVREQEQLILERDALIADRDQLLGWVSILAQERVAQQLVRDAKSLWPAVPARVKDLEAWGASLETLLEGQVQRQALKRWLGSSLELVSAVGMQDRQRQRFLQDQLVALEGAISEAAALAPALAERLEVARELHRRTCVDVQEQWREAADRVARDPRFRGLRLAPQLGLLPLGPDPETGLEEFAHVLSGPAPRRDAEGDLDRSDFFGVVLVLVPGGRVLRGAVPQEPQAGSGEAPVDPDCRSWEVGVIEVDLDPYLISKYEFTQEQWYSHTGEKPSRAHSDKWFHRRPVDQVDWITAVRVLGELDLELPSEAHWEAAARGGTTTVWYTGNDERSIEGHVNLMDLRAKGDLDWPESRYVGWLDDGASGARATGSLLPNPYGLFDVMGNVYEWCTDGFQLEGQEQPLRRIEGGQEGVRSRVVRGGSHRTVALDCRSAARGGYSPTTALSDVGLRPMRRLRD